MSVNNKKEYIFPECYKEQLASVLGHSFAFNIDRFDKSEPVKTETGKTGILTVRKIKITMSASLLPRHCNPELVEQALANLAKNPENSDLLKTLAEYTKNNRFERVGSYGLGTVSLIISSIIVAATAVATFIFLVHNPGFWIAFSVVPLELFFTFNIFSALIYSNIIATVLLSMLVSDNLKTHRLNVLGLKIGRWVGECVKGINQPVNLQALDEKLNQLISEQTKAPQHEERVAPVTYTKIYPSLLFTSNHSDLTIQDAATNNDDSAQQVPENRFNMK